VPIPRAYPVKILPAGLSDAFDSTEAFPGASTALINLIFDPANPECVISRPGVGVAVITQAQFNSYAGSGTATYISEQVCAGTRVYGFVSMSGGTYNGVDVPFIYDFNTGAFLAITGLVAGQLPASPLTSGPWTPPTVAIVGNFAIFTHPGFSGVGSNFFGAVNLTTLAWTVQNLTGNPLPSVPLTVANYNNRACFAIGNQTFQSDSLSPLTATGSSQPIAVTHGDNTPIVAYAGLPVQTTAGGVVAQLLVFKPSQIWYLAGDVAVSGNPLTTNFISLTMGSNFPRSVTNTPEGVMFIGTDGAMVIDPFGLLKAITHQGRQVADIRLPFTGATTPSRAGAAFAQNVYRVCLQTTVGGNLFAGDYWFDRNRRRWNGPHTFVYDCASQFGASFLLSGPATGANLYLSTPLPIPTSVYNDAGTSISVHWTSSDFPKTGHMNEVQIVESTQEFAASGISIPYLITMYDDEGNYLSSATVSTPAAGILWDGGALWDSGPLWATTNIAPSQYIIPWTVPLVADKFVIDIQAAASASLMIGAHFSRYQDTGYVSSG
jgi:hypothetical protein